MSGSSYKKFRKQKIKKQMNEHYATKTVAEALTTLRNMSDADWEEFAEALANEMGLEVDKEEMEYIISNAKELD